MDVLKDKLIFNDKNEPVLNDNNVVINDEYINGFRVICTSPRLSEEENERIKSNIAKKIRIILGK